MNFGTTWRKMLDFEMRDNGDPGPVVALAPADDAVWDAEFDPGYGRANGAPVLAWTEEWVYFPVEYDGSEHIASAPRHPRAEGQRHVGG